MAGSLPRRPEEDTGTAGVDLNRPDYTAGRPPETSRRTPDTQRTLDRTRATPNARSPSQHPSRYPHPKIVFQRLTIDRPPPIGGLRLKRITISKRMRAKLAEVKDQLKRRRHEPLPEQGKWLASVVRGHLAYYAVPGNSHAIKAFRDQVTRHWCTALRRRSQRHRLDWNRMHRIANHWLPPARILHPYPDERLYARTQGRSPVRCVS